MSSPANTARRCWVAVLSVYLTGRPVVTEKGVTVVVGDRARKGVPTPTVTMQLDESVDVLGKLAKVMKE